MMRVHYPKSQGRGRTRLVIVMMIMIALPLLIGLISTTKASTPANRVFTITARQWAYDPSVIEVNQGDNVTIVLQSADVSHGIYIEGYNIRADLILTEGKPTQVELHFIADKSGTFIFKCTVPCGSFHPFMTGVLKVDPNYEFTGASAVAVAIAILVSMLFMVYKR